MIKFMLDSNIFDELAAYCCVTQRLKMLVKNNKVSLYYTHIQKAQISHNNVPEAKKKQFEHLCNELDVKELKTTGALLSKQNSIPLATFPLKFSDCKSYDSIRGNKKGYKEAEDAAIAQTAADCQLDYIVTIDSIFNRNLKPPKIDFQEFKRVVEGIE